MSILSLGQAVRRRREELGLSREQLAVEAHTSSSTLARLELSDAMPNVRILAALARRLDLPLGALVEAGPVGAGPKVAP